MSYDNPKSFTLSLTGVNFASGAGARKVRLPKGYEARVADIVISGTTLFTAVTTAGLVRLGLVGEAARFAEFSAGTLAAGETIAATNQAGALKVDSVSRQGIVIPKDTDVLINIVAPTGGTPAGVGDIHILFDLW